VPGGNPAGARRPPRCCIRLEAKATEAVAPGVRTCPLSCPQILQRRCRAKAQRTHNARVRAEPLGCPPAGVPHDRGLLVPENEAPPARAVGRVAAGPARVYVEGILSRRAAAQPSTRGPEFSLIPTCVAWEVFTGVSLDPQVHEPFRCELVFEGSEFAYAPKARSIWRRFPGGDSRERADGGRLQAGDPRSPLGVLPRLHRVAHILEWDARSRADGFAFSLVAGPPTVQRLVDLTDTTRRLPFIEG
jgi:hypothetical protein